MGPKQKLKFLRAVEEEVNVDTYEPYWPKCVICQLAGIDGQTDYAGERATFEIIKDKYGMALKDVRRIYFGVVGLDNNEEEERDDWKQLGETKEGAIQIVKEILKVPA